MPNEVRQVTIFIRYYTHPTACGQRFRQIMLKTCECGTVLDDQHIGYDEMCPNCGSMIRYATHVQGQTIDQTVSDMREIEARMTEQMTNRGSIDF